MTSQNRAPNRRPQDDRLRALLEPPPEVVRQVVAQALREREAGGPHLRRPGLRRFHLGRLPSLGLAAASFLGVLLLAGGLWWSSSRPIPKPPALRASYHLENSGEVVTIVGPTGQVQALISGVAP